MAMDERLISLFNEELRHLRETAAEFGRDYPETAQHLDPSAKPFKGTVADPYVERLLEGVAFLAARVRLKLDSQFPQFTQGLIETLYPDFLAPVPSMAIFELQAPVSAPPPPEGITVLKNTMQVHGMPEDELLASLGRTTPCVFTLGHDVKLLPLELTAADWMIRRIHETGLSDDPKARDWNAKSALRLRFRKTNPAPWKEIRMDPLVLHIPRSDGLGPQIFEGLFSSQIGMTVRNLKSLRGTTVYATQGRPVRKFGFEDSQALLPVCPRTFQGHRLLREYFALPERFMFFELRDFQHALSQCQGDEIEIIIAMSETGIHLERSVTAQHLKLFCAPAINLFAKSFSQVIEAERFNEFHVVPDAGRPLSFEVYSVDSVEGYTDSSQYGQPFRPFFESHAVERTGETFFAVSRQPRSHGGAHQDSHSGSELYRGTEVFLSLVDSHQAPYNGELNQLYIKAKVTNRHLPLWLLEKKSTWTLTGGIKAAISISTSPTRPSFNPVDGAYAWRLLNLLAVNYLSLGGSEGDSAGIMREMLMLYAGESMDWAKAQVSSLRRIEGSTISRPLCEAVENLDAQRIVAIVRGLEISLYFDEAAFYELGTTVLGSVIEEFFGRYVGINSFTETVIKTTDGQERTRWPSRTGIKPLI